MRAVEAEMGQKFRMVILKYFLFLKKRHNIDNKCSELWNCGEQLKYDPQ